MSEDNCASMFVHVCHRLLVYFMSLGCFLPEKYLWLHLLLWPIVFAHWQFNDQKCCVTQLEIYLKNKKCDASPHIQDDHGNDYYFLKKLLKDFNIEMTKEDMQTGIHVLFTTSWAISLFRFTKKYKR
jgi:hypothetical protein